MPPEVTHYFQTNTVCLSFFSLQENLVWHNPVTLPQLRIQCVEEIVYLFLFIFWLFSTCFFFIDRSLGGVNVFIRLEAKHTEYLTNICDGYSSPFSFIILRSKSSESQKIFVNYLVTETLPEVTLTLFIVFIYPTYWKFIYFVIFVWFCYCHSLYWVTCYVICGIYTLVIISRTRLA